MTFLENLPDNSGRRLVKVLLRCTHLVGMAGLVGTVMASGSGAGLWFWVTLLSGLALLGLDAIASPIWFVQLRGVALYVKLLLLIPLHGHPELAIWWLMAMIVLSGFFSHAPGWIRYFSVYHGRMIQSSRDLAG
jgi:hypothetical protein